MRPVARTGAPKRLPIEPVAYLFLLIKPHNGINFPYFGRLLAACRFSPLAATHAAAYCRLRRCASALRANTYSISRKHQRAAFRDPPA